MTMINDINTIKQNYPNAQTRFNKIKDYLLSHNEQALYDEMTAPGIVEYKTAREWFEDYYINDENEGPEMANQIKAEIKQADETGYYYSDPDFNYGYDETPTEFRRVPDAELDDAINQLCEKLHHSDYKMYTAIV